MSEPWEHVTLTLKPDQVRLILGVLKDGYLFAARDGHQAQHANAIGEVIAAVEEQFTE